MRRLLAEDEAGEGGELHLAADVGDQRVETETAMAQVAFVQIIESARRPVKHVDDEVDGHRTRLAQQLPQRALSVLVMGGAATSIVSERAQESRVVERRHEV